MEIDEAIKHCEEKAREQEYYAKLEKNNLMIQSCFNCANEHRQLAEWLKELRDNRKRVQKCIERLEELKKDYTGTFTADGIRWSIEAIKEELGGYRNDR